MRRFLVATACSLLFTVAVAGLVALSSQTRVVMRLIVPPWWALPIYSVLRAIPIKTGGIAAALAAIFGLCMLPWIILADARRRLFRPTALAAAAAFVVTIFVLGFSGAHEPSDAVFAGDPGPFLLDANLNSHMWLARCATVYFFAYVAVIAPALDWKRKSDPAAVFA